jgi:hypothetical protein
MYEGRVVNFQLNEKVKRCVNNILKSSWYKVLAVFLIILY